MLQSKRCPVAGCATLCHPDYVMCVAHWRLVPKPIQAAVWREYKLKPGSAGHLAACQLAIRCANINLNSSVSSVRSC